AGRGERIFVGRVRTALARGLALGGPVVRVRPVVLRTERRSRPVAAGAWTIRFLAAVVLLPAGCRMQPGASLLQVMRTGFQQAFGHCPELADAGHVAGVAMVAGRSGPAL